MQTKATLLNAVNENIMQNVYLNIITANKKRGTSFNRI